jgi:creatinine amidohydrolase
MNPESAGRHAPAKPMELAHMTSPDAGSALAGAVVLVPFGSVEPHGPHLPLSTDTILAVEACRRAADLIQMKGTRAVVAPAVPYAVTDYAAGFPGRISIRPETATALARDLCHALAALAPHRILLVTLHFEPAHLQGLRAAAADCAKATGVATSLVEFTKRRNAARVGGEFATGSCHAGAFESSLVLAVRPETVKNDLRLALAENFVNLPESMGAGARTFLECGMPEAYCGAPAAASADEGRRVYAVLADVIAETALASA